MVRQERPNGNVGFQIGGIENLQDFRSNVEIDTYQYSLTHASTPCLLLNTASTSFRAFSPLCLSYRLCSSHASTVPQFALNSGSPLIRSLYDSSRLASPIGRASCRERV